MLSLTRFLFGSVSLWFASSNQRSDIESILWVVKQTTTKQQRGDEMTQHNFLRRFSEKWLRRQFVPRGQVGIVYGYDGLFKRFILPGERARLKWLREFRYGDISTDPFVVQEIIEGFSEDGLPFFVELTALAKFNPTLIEDPAFSVDKCLSNPDWPKFILRKYAKAGTIWALGEYDGWDLHSGKMVRTFNNLLTAYIKGKLFDGFELLSVDVHRIVPPDELVDAKQVGRGVIVSAFESLGHLSSQQIAEYQLLARGRSVMMGQAAVNVTHVETDGDQSQKTRHYTMLNNDSPPSRARSKGHNKTLPSRSERNHSRTIIEN